MNMTLPQKVILVLGALALIYFTFFNAPLHTIVVPNPAHIPYSRATSAYINARAVDYGMIFWHAVGVIGATAVAFVLSFPRMQSK